MSWTYIAVSLLMMPLVVALIDVVAATRAKYTAPIVSNSASLDSFAVLVPIWGSLRYLENVAYLSAYGDRVVLCTTAEGTADFYAGLEALSREHRFQIFIASPVAGQRRSSGRETGGTTRDRLVREVLHTVTMPYVVCIDADTVTDRPLGELAGEIAERNLDLASVPLHPVNRDSWLSRLQAHEYRVAMSLRRVAPWLVSGGCHAGRTDALRQIMDRHSLFFQGNDVETGVIGDALGLRVGHVDFAVPTIVPSRLRPWLRQRLAWAGGEFRLFVVNFPLIRRHPLFWAYGLIIMFAALPLRWTNVVTYPRALLGVGIVYLALISFINWRHRDRWLLLLPFYVAFNSLVLTALALPSYLWMAWRARNAGLIRPKRTPAPVAATGVVHLSTRRRPRPDTDTLVAAGISGAGPDDQRLAPRAEPSQVRG
jgi:hypothetical protein